MVRVNQLDPVLVGKLHDHVLIGVTHDRKTAIKTLGRDRADNSLEYFHEGLG
jgi:hypothetical protein